MRFPIAPTQPCQHLMLLVFWILPILISVQWYLIALICNSLITHDVEHLFIAYLPSVYLLRWSVVQIFFSFLIGLFVFLLLSFRSSLYIFNTSLTKYVFCKVFSKAVDCPFIFLIVSFTEHKFLILMKSNISSIFHG